MSGAEVYIDYLYWYIYLQCMFGSIVGPNQHILLQNQSILLTRYINNLQWYMYYWVRLILNQLFTLSYL